MHLYTPRNFELGSLHGLSEKQIATHLSLYEGYVKHVNLLRETIHNLEKTDKEKYAFAIMETRRRLGFEFDGMRMHEYYFTQFEGGHHEPEETSPFTEATKEKYGSQNAFLDHLQTVAMTRGIGWTVLYQDIEGKTIHTAWVGDHEIGQLAGLPILLALDMWEHAFMVDYLPAEKKQYVDAFFKNLNWKTIEERFIS